MKAKIKKPLLVLVFAVLLTFVSCEKDSSETENPPIDNSSYRTMPIKDVPGIKDYITDKNALNAKTIEGSGELEKAIFYETAIEVIDEYKNVNYSASFIYEDTPENIFYNLVINKLPSGNETAYIFKFICNPEDFENYSKNNYNFGYFKGVTEVSIYKGKINGSNFRDGEDEECPKIFIPSVSGMAGTNGAGGNGGAVANSGFSTTIIGYNAPAGTSGIISVSYGGTTYYAGGGTSTSGSGSSSSSGGGGGTPPANCGCYYAGNGIYRYLSNGRIYHEQEAQQRANTGSNYRDDCPEVVPPVGPVQVNDGILIVKNIKRMLPTLTKQELLWLSQHPNEAAEINTFLGYNPDEEEKEFANEIIDRMREDPEFTSIKPFLIEKEIDDSQMNPCAQQILAQIKELTQNDFAKIIAKLGDEASVYKVTIIPASDLQNNNIAYTRWSEPPIVSAVSSYNYTIKVNTNFLNTGTKLAIAATIIHEMVHAYFLSLYDDHMETHDNSMNTFPILWDFYVAHPQISGGNIAQHNQMAASYIDIMARTLQEYNTGTPVAEGAQPEQIYIDLAWGGLEATPPYNALSDQDMRRIEAVNWAENENNTQTANNINYSPISIPCN